MSLPLSQNATTAEHFTTHAPHLSGSPCASRPVARVGASLVGARTVRKAKGRRRLRANGFTACLALRPIEQTGDSSTPLRMTCFAISIRETRRSYLRPTCHAEERCEKVGRTFLSASMPTMSPRKCVYGALSLGTIEKTGDSSAALRMTCFAITIGETCRSGLGTTCHPEERFEKVGRTFLSAHVSWSTCEMVTEKGQSRLFPHCRAVEGKGPTRSPRKSVYRVFGVKDNRTDGRFFAFAQNDMLCNQHWRNLSVRSRHKLSS